MDEGEDEWIWAEALGCEGHRGKVECVCTEDCEFERHDDAGDGEWDEKDGEDKSFETHGV